MGATVSDAEGRGASENVVQDDTPARLDTPHQIIEAGLKVSANLFAVAVVLNFPWEMLRRSRLATVKQIPRTAATRIHTSSSRPLLGLMAVPRRLPGSSGECEAPNLQHSGFFGPSLGRRLGKMPLDDDLFLPSFGPELVDLALPLGVVHKYIDDVWADNG